jgi:error-prone DNA polymerase
LLKSTAIAAIQTHFQGKVQRQGDVIHLVAHRLTDPSAMLRSVGDRDQAFSLPHGRGDEAKPGRSGDQRDLKAKGLKAREIYIPDLHIHCGIKVKTR